MTCSIGRIALVRVAVSRAVPSPGPAAAVAPARTTEERTSGAADAERPRRAAVGDAA
jgi:hypothetical protein